MIKRAEVLVSFSALFALNNGCSKRGNANLDCCGRGSNVADSSTAQLSRRRFTTSADNGFSIQDLQNGCVCREGEDREVENADRCKGMRKTNKETHVLLA